ncbi:hypothetical protein [Nesterenkonia sp. CF4.4]|uniref:hypothetical protein n=1 Tax=Nesterenkonia sp. CF4.4 TaxID=3373079 RepID=UPI003EE77579
MYLTSPDAAEEATAAAPDYLALLLTWGAPVVVAVLATWLAHRFTFRRELERARQERLSVAAKAVIEDAAGYVWAFERFVNNLSAHFHFIGEGAAGRISKRQVRAEVSQADEGASEALADLEAHESVMRMKIAGLKLYAAPDVYEPLEELMVTAYLSLSRAKSATGEDADAVLRGAVVDLRDSLDRATIRTRKALAPARR